MEAGLNRASQSCFKSLIWTAVRCSQAKAPEDLFLPGLMPSYCIICIAAVWSSNRKPEFSRCFWKRFGEMMEMICAVQHGSTWFNVVQHVSTVQHIRGLSQHNELVRCSVATAGNDHRLGAQEAPPAIISLYPGQGELGGLGVLSIWPWVKTYGTIFGWLFTSINPIYFVH